MSAPARVGPEVGADLRTRMRAGRRHDLVGAAIAVATLLVLATGLALAEVLLAVRDLGVDLPFGDILAATVGGGDVLARFAIFEIEMPRVLAAILSGGIFGLTGHLYQQVVRNPLATPDVIGITGGATAGAVAVLVLTPGAGIGVRAAALLGAALTVAVVFLLAWRDGLDTYRLVLVGIGMSGITASLTSFLLTIADENSTLAALRWTSGSLAAAGWPDVRLMALVGVLAFGLALAAARGLRALALGDDLGRGLGARITLLRIGILVGGAAVAAQVTSVVGPLGFVALVAGPLAIRLQPRGPHLLLAPLIGVLLVLAADLIAQYAPVISPVPTGVVTAVVGAPVFVWLLLRGREEVR